LRRGRERTGNCPLGEGGEMMVELISAIDGLCRRLDWKKNIE
jgi:hypothetical protein